MQTPVIAARLSNPASNAVFEKIRDWTISGLVGESFWLDIADPNSIIRVRANGVEKFDVNNWIGTFNGEIQLFTLQVLKSSGSKITEREASAAITSIDALRQPYKQLVNVVFPVANTTAAKDVHFETKLNLVALPFDGFAPDRKGVQISATTNSYFTNCAKELVTVAGMWPGQTESVLEGIHFVPGSSQNVILERSFVRYVDASNFVRSVISKVIDGDGKTLPKPVDSAGTELQALSGPEAEKSVKMVADMFVATHPTLKFEQFPNQFSKAPIGAGLIQLLVYYFTWVWKWIIRQPGNMLQKAIADKKLAMARSVQELFGTKSQFMVLVGGVSAHDHPDGVPMAANSIMDTVQSQLASPVKPAPAAPFGLWKDMVEVAVSLADGGPTTVSDLEMPAQVGVGRKVVNDPNLITPNAFEKSFDIPANLNVPFKGHRLSASDPLTARLVQEQLDSSIKNRKVDATSIASVGRLQQELSLWRDSNKSFVWTIGDKLADSIYEGLKIWEDLSSQVTEINDSELVAAEAKAQKTLSNLFKGAFGIIGVSLAAWGVQALWVYLTFGVWPVVASWWPIPTTIVAVLFFAWNIVGIFVMHGAVKELFKLEHALEKANERIVFAKKAKAHIWTEISRLTTYYQQYQAWVAILSRFLHRNPNAGGGLGVQESISSAQSLPQSMTIGRLLPSVDGDDQDMTKKISAGFHRTGWLTALMTNILTEKVANYNVIASDSFAGPTTPLGQALEWVSGEAVFEAIKLNVTQEIQQLAISGAAYQGWKVELTNAIGEKEITNGRDLISKLGAGEDYMPADFLLMPESSVVGASKVDRNQSAVAFDERLSPASDLSRHIKLEKNAADSRSLDFLGIRFEATELLAAKDLRIFHAEGFDPLNTGQGFGENKPGAQA